MIYSSFEGLADNAELDRYIPAYDQVVPITAAAATGIFYKSTGKIVFHTLFIILSTNILIQQLVQDL